MSCPFTGSKVFCAGQNFLSQPKNWTAFSASSKPCLHQIHRIFNITFKLAMSQNGKSESLATVRYRQMHTDSKLSKIESLDFKSQPD